MVGHHETRTRWVVARRGCIVSIVTDAPKDAAVYRSQLDELNEIAHRTIEVQTMDVYGPLAPGYLRTEIDRLSFRPKSGGFTSPVLRGAAEGDLPR
jgi:hypothetical protein